MLRTASYAKRLAGKADPELVREELRLKCRRSLYFLGKAVLGYRDLTPEFHRGLSYEIQNPLVKRKLNEVPRGHLKTTLSTRTKPIWRWIQKPDPPLFYGPNDTMLLAMSGGDVASVQIQAVEQQFESNTLFQWLFPELIPEDFQKTIWNTMAMRIGGAESGEPSLRVGGVGSKITGLHVHGIIEDDLVDETIAESAIEIQRRIDWHQYAFPLLIHPKYDWIDTIGNRWGKRDVNGWIRENEPDCQIMFHQAIKKDGTPLWPERFSLEDLGKLRIRLGAFKFSCQYMNDPKDPDAAAFKSGWVKHYELAIDPRGRQVLVLDSGEIVLMGELNKYMVMDPAMSPGNRSDRTGIVVTGIDPKGRIFILEATALRKDPFEALNTVYDIYNKWRPMQLGIEAIAFQRLLLTQLDRMAKVRLQWLPVIAVKGLSTPGAKETRINQVVGETFASGRVYLRKEMTDFLDEYSWFPDPTSTRDLLDAFSLSDQLWIFSGRTFKPDQDTAEEWRKRALAAGMCETTGY